MNPDSTCEHVWTSPEALGCAKCGQLPSARRLAEMVIQLRAERELLKGALAAQDDRERMNQHELAPSGEALREKAARLERWLDTCSAETAMRLHRSNGAIVIRDALEAFAALLASQETLLQSKTLVCDECSGVIPAAEPIILCDICGPKDRQADIDAATVELRAKWEAADAALTKLKADRNQSHLEAWDELEEVLFGKTGNTWQEGQGDRVGRVLMRCYTAGLYTADKQLAEADAARHRLEAQVATLKAFTERERALHEAKGKGGQSVGYSPSISPSVLKELERMLAADPTP